MKIHYFEHNYTGRGKLIASTYNYFEMQEDFVEMIHRCKEVLPSTKHELFDRLEQLI